MTEREAAATDFIALAQAGAALRTRDRREVGISAIDAAAGRISGSVAMVGTCHWRRDGRLQDAPCGGAGPLDLVAPAPSPDHGPRHASMQEALADPARGSACCD